MARPTMALTPRRAARAVLSVLSVAVVSVLSQGASAAQPGYKVPPRPLASEQTVLQPGMSKKDWHDAYKEEGRPMFKKETVKRFGGTVQRD